MPFIMPVTVSETVDNGLVVANEAGLLPSGGRRAGFLAHDFHMPN